MKITSQSLVCAVACLALASCDSDKTSPTNVNRGPEPGPQHKDDVLYNLELAYNERNSSEFEKLLDENFSFVFSEVDYNSGTTPRHWGESSEIEANRNILGANLPDDKRLAEINLKLDYPPDNWTEEPPNPHHPGESWYIQTIGYDLRVKMANGWEYRATGNRAVFKLRWDDAIGQWGIVEWHDGSGVGVSDATGGLVPELFSWGILKALYGEKRCEDLTSRDDVLYNLEYSYNQRNYTEFTKLIDEEFVFKFSEADFNSGVVGFPSWERSRELSANEKMFDPNLPRDNRVTDIFLSLDFPARSWSEQPSNESHPDETWFTQTVDYRLVVLTADWEYRTLSKRAQFTIRWDDSANWWRIVLWRDDVGALIARSPGGPAVEDITWGAIKAMYLDKKDG